MHFHIFIRKQTGEFAKLPSFHHFCGSSSVSIVFTIEFSFIRMGVTEPSGQKNVERVVWEKLLIVAGDRCPPGGVGDHDDGRGDTIISRFDGSILYFCYSQPCGISLG